MSITTTTTIRRGIGAVLLGGAAAGVIGLATSGTAAATPKIPVPVIPGNPVISQFVNPGGPVELNPQPLPPRTWAPGADVALNPQPVPPSPPDPGPEKWSWVLPGA
jgi:hypothetical protein